MSLCHVRICVYESETQYKNKGSVFVRYYFHFQTTPGNPRQPYILLGPSWDIFPKAVSDGAQKASFLWEKGCPVLWDRVGFTQSLFK